MTRRQVRFSGQFFDRLDELLPPERPGDGGPSASDFLLHDLPNVIDALAESYEGVTIPSGYDESTRVLVAPGLLARTLVVYTTLIADDVVEAFYIDLELD